ncbi:hypothetical protein Pmani_013310 [Petrolisthes manimaculis]|uniref:Neural-cadherin n=1 Tax=Petrolisthes manimaculis TaxID=1843537 RepID=A0AAE1U9E2_9EUCA|nr:hypothetical protein Pmani_013310 [Petrolisthes manimaculis]
MGVEGPQTPLSSKLEAATDLRVDLISPHEDPARPDHQSQGHVENIDTSSVSSLASTILPLQVVDANVTSLVTPRLTRSHTCHAHYPETCTPISCLNGGRCVRSLQGNKCVCPGGSSGWQCKVLARTFLGSGWAWVTPLPRCLPSTLSLKVLTTRPHALLFYSGPMTPAHRPQSSPTPMLALQIKDGMPQVLVEGGLEPVKLVVNTTVSDGDWHTLHLRLDTKGVALMVDMCGRGWESGTFHSHGHCLARAMWGRPWRIEGLLETGPLQVGGLAHSPPTQEDHGWGGDAPTAHPLHGCLSHLTLNGQLVDLGEPASSRGSTAGCQPQEEACHSMGGKGRGCGYRGTCVGGLRHPECQCEAGWGGVGCDTPTTPATLGQSSFMKVALSFTPPPSLLTVQSRVRSRARDATGLLFHITAQHNKAAFTLHLREGVPCATFWGPNLTTRVACVEGRGVSDGEWHVVFAERHGDNLIVYVDDGDGWRRNESLASLGWEEDGDGPVTLPPPLLVDKHEGVTVGGRPDLAGTKLLGVEEDLIDVCVDDLRVSGRPLPLPPVVNGTSWGQVTSARNIQVGCRASDPCTNTTCVTPLICTTSWGQPTCSCGPGLQASGRTCEDVDECVWSPCLHGATCHNLRPGYLCVCGPMHTGPHCQWFTFTAPVATSLTAPTAIAAVTASLILLSVVALVVSVHLHRHRTNLTLREQGVGRKIIIEMKVEPGKEGNKGGRDGNEGGEGEREGGRKGGKMKDTTQETFLDCLRFRIPGSASKEKGKSRSSSSSSGGSCVEGAGDTAKQKAKVGPENTDTKTLDPDLPRDDLRAYAYEGDGSSSGSLTSTISELKVEINLKEEEEQKMGRTSGGSKTTIPLVPEFLEVMDLLKNLPEATNRTLSLAATPKAPCSPTTTTSAASSIVSLKPGDSTKSLNIRTRLAHVSTNKALKERSKKEGSPAENRSKSSGSSVVAITTASGDSELSTVC